MTLTAVFFFVVGLALAVLVGIGIACYRLRPALKTRSGQPATLPQAVAKALGGGGGGPIEPF